jgi:hypothetical protein
MIYFGVFFFGMFILCTALFWKLDCFGEDPQERS